MADKRVCECCEKEGETWFGDIFYQTAKGTQPLRVDICLACKARPTDEVARIILAKVAEVVAQPTLGDAVAAQTV